MNIVRRANVLALAVVVGVLGVGVSGAGALSANHVHATSVESHAVKMKKLTFTASYVGNVKILFGASRVSGTMSGAGKGTTLGQGTVTASGATTSFSTSSASDPLTGNAVLKGPGGSITVKTVSVYASTTSSAAPTSSSPDPVVVAGTVKVLKGTGKFAGASGTLSVHASFTVHSISGSETQKFTATLKGSLSVKA
jgi:lipopolysaccharide export system protein LptA